MGELTLRSNTAHSVVLYMKMKMSVEDACLEALKDLKDIHTDFRGGVSIYAIDKNGKNCMFSVKSMENGLPECDDHYWYWNGSNENISRINVKCRNW